VLAELVDAGLLVTEDGHYLTLTVPLESYSAPRARDGKMSGDARRFS
jgi:hypothetical protein